MANLLEGDASRLPSALLTALGDFREVADIFAQHTPDDLDKKCFYHELFIRCLRLQQALDIETDPSPIQGFVRGALQQFESLVVTPLARHKVQDDHRHTFPGLRTLHQTLTTLHDPHLKLKALRECVTFGGSKQQSALIELLSHGCTVMKSEAHTGVGALECELALPRKTRQKPPDDVRFAASTLFSVLKSKGACDCEPGHSCIVQLSLETHRAQFNGCNFDLYFGLETFWQEARVKTSTHMSPEITSVSIKHHAGRDTIHESTKRKDHKRLVEKLCKDIISITKRFPDFRLRFSLEKDCLWKLTSEESDFVIDKSKQPTSLTQLLDEASFLINDRIRRILSVSLSYAVLHLHETSWLPPKWGSCNVMFFRSSVGLPMRPYLTAELSDESAPQQVDSDSDEEEFDPDDLLLPPFPCLVGLAIVLMELHKGASLKSLSEVYDVQLHDEKDQAARFITARNLFNCCKHEFTDQTRMAIFACLDPKIGLDSTGENLDDIGLQSVIYDQIVRRLEDELEYGFDDVKIDQLDYLIQGLDLANGGMPLSRKRKHNTSGLTSTGLSPTALDKPDIDRRVRFHPSSTDVIAEAADDCFPPTAEANTSNTQESSKRQSESTNKIMSPKPTSIEAYGNFVAPTVAKKLSGNRPDTLRVMNIPDDMSKLDLSTRLEHHFAWKCKIHSLARASRNTRWKKHATVTFPGLDNITLSDTMRKLQILQHQIVEDHFEFDTGFLGLTPLYDEGASAIVDIIAIEGLGTNPFGTFRAPQGDLMWLRDFLPQSFPSCRILLYGYDSKVPDSMSNQSVPEIASTCKNFVTNFRIMTKTDERPIIWLGQSMGGLIVQEVLVQAHEYRSKSISGNLSDQTIGFLGYGVPINGLRNESLLNAVKKQPNFEMIRSICLEGDRPSRYLEVLAGRFALCSTKMSIHHFYETNPSQDIWDPEAAPERRVEHQEVVGRENRYWVSRNHSELVKVPSRTDLVYTITEQVISLIHDEHNLHGVD